MSIIPNVITSKFARQILLARKNSPHVMFGVGVAASVTSTVLACRGTLKLEEVLAEGERQEKLAERALNLEKAGYEVKDYNKDLTIIKVKTAGRIFKLYGPALGVGLVGISCLTGSHVVMNKRNVGLTAAYAALDKGFREYRERVTGAFGEDRERELRYGSVEKEIVEETETGPQVKTVKRAGEWAGKSVYARFFDEYTKNWSPEPEYNKIFIRCQQNYANDLLQARGHVLLNEVYDMLGIERSSAGCVVGWVLDKGGDNFIDFGVFDKNDATRDFVNGREASILLDFNVDGVIYDKI